MADLFGASFLVEGILLVGTIFSIVALRRSGRSGSTRSLN